MPGYCLVVGRLCPSPVGTQP
ncbi:hypothetical protein AYI68_g6400, partial [Smittium mucronatum]